MQASRWNGLVAEDGNPLGWYAHGRKARGQADHEELAHVVGWSGVRFILVTTNLILFRETGVLDRELNLASIPYMGSPEGLRHFLVSHFSHLCAPSSWAYNGCNSRFLPATYTILWSRVGLRVAARLMVRSASSSQAGIMLKWAGFTLFTPLRTHLARERKRGVSWDSCPPRIPYYDLGLVYGSRRVRWCAQRPHHMPTSCGNGLVSHFSHLCASRMYSTVRSVTSRVLMCFDRFLPAKEVAVFRSGFQCCYPDLWLLPDPSSLNPQNRLATGIPLLRAA